MSKCDHFYTTDWFLILGQHSAISTNYTINLNCHEKHEFLFREALTLLADHDDQCGHLLMWLFFFLVSCRMNVTVLFFHYHHLWAPFLFSQLPMTFYVWYMFVCASFPPCLYCCDHVCDDCDGDTCVYVVAHHV